MGTGIALGSNMGDRLARLKAARKFLTSLALPGSAVRISRLYETVPQDCPPGTSPFLNAVMEISTSLDPHGLLRRLLDFEADLGRARRRPRNAPRTIDLDILYAGALRCDTPELTLPHPRMFDRRFVLQPLADIRPELVPPGWPCSVAERLGQLPADGVALLPERL